MSLKAVLSQEEFDQLSEDVQGVYEYDAEQGNYSLSWDVVKEHPGVRKVKKTADDKDKTAKQVQSERDQLKERLGPLAESEDVDLSLLDEDSANRIAEYLRGESNDLTQGQGNDGKGKDGTDLAKVKANARKPLERNLEQVTQERDQLKKQLEQVVIDNSLNEAVSEVGIQGPYQKAVKAMFANRIKVEKDDEGSTTALIDGEYGEQPVSKYLKEWAQTEEGSAFVAGHTGSGARGSRQTSGGSAKNPFSDSNFNLTEQARLAREAPEQARRLAQEAGRKAPV